MNTLDWIGKWAEYTPDKTAIACLDSNEKYSFRQVSVFADRLIDKFIELDLHRGDRVAVLAENGPYYIVLLTACQRLGLILVPFNYRLQPAELNTLVDDCTPKLLVYTKGYTDKIAKLDVQENELMNTEKLQYYYKDNIGTIPRKHEINENEPLFIFYTSGTTSRPKGVIYTNKMMFWNSLNTSMQLGITYRDSTLNVLPPYHTSGWHIFVTPLLHKGATVYTVKKFDAEKVLCLLALYEISLFIALPTMLLMMQQTEVFKTVNLKKLRYIVSGGETVPHTLVADYKNKKGLEIRPGYGLTEAGPGITSLHHNMTSEKPNSIGKPNFYLELKLVAKNGQRARANEIGEICIKGNVVTPGYWNNSVLTNNKIKNGWLHTGDFAREDEDGYLFLKGRGDDMYISGGENIYPQEVENAILKCDTVKKAVVLSNEDDTWGQCGIAFVTLKEKGGLGFLKKHLDKHLVSFKHPKYVFVLDEIPVTDVGKIDRKALYYYFEEIKGEQH